MTMDNNGLVDTTLMNLRGSRGDETVVGNVVEVERQNVSVAAIDFEVGVDEIKLIAIEVQVVFVEYRVFDGDPVKVGLVEASVVLTEQLDKAGHVIIILLLVGIHADVEDRRIIGIGRFGLQQLLLQVKMLRVHREVIV